MLWKGIKLSRTFYFIRMGYSRKNPNVGLRIYFSEMPPGNFKFVTLPQEILEKKALTPGNSANLCDTPWKFRSQQPRPLEVLH